MSAPYHSQYWANALSLQGSGGNNESLSRSIANARVGPNPHQIDAALFALRSPLSSGGILVDDVGPGKTIEAGIVLAQWCTENANPAPAWQEQAGSVYIAFLLPAVLPDIPVVKAHEALGAGGADTKLALSLSQVCPK